MPGGYRIGPKLPLREEHSQDSSRKEHAMEKRLATPQKARNAGLHDERLFGVGGVESWSRRRPTVPYVRACSITVPVAAIERSP